MFEPCPTCDGLGVDITKWESANERHAPCPACVGGRVVSESVIEEMAKAMYREGAPLLNDQYPRKWARAASRVVLEHMEDNE